MEKLEYYQENGKECYRITRKKSFNRGSPLEADQVARCFNFAYNITFGRKGQHRNHRSGGQHRRTQGEVFCNACQGKFAEFSLHRELGRNSIEYPEPNLDAWELGRWDFGDADIQGEKTCIKSAKHFSNLLLLETKDWDFKGEYKHGEDSKSIHYDLFVLVRIQPSLEELLNKQELLQADSANREILEALITRQKWEYDIPGFITHEEWLSAVQNKYILPQSSYLNGKTRMDAENYYVQSGDMHGLQDLVNHFQKRLL